MAAAAVVGTGLSSIAVFSLFGIALLLWGKSVFPTFPGLFGTLYSATPLAADYSSLNWLKSIPIGVEQAKLPELSIPDVQIKIPAYAPIRKKRAGFIAVSKPKKAERIFAKAKVLPAIQAVTEAQQSMQLPAVEVLAASLQGSQEATEKEMTSLQNAFHALHTRFILAARMDEVQIAQTMAESLESAQRVSESIPPATPLSQPPVFTQHKNRFAKKKASQRVSPQIAQSVEVKSQESAPLIPSPQELLKPMVDVGQIPSTLSLGADEERVEVKKPMATQRVTTQKSVPVARVTPWKYEAAPGEVTPRVFMKPSIRNREAQPLFKDELATSAAQATQPAPLPKTGDSSLDIQNEYPLKAPAVVNTQNTQATTLASNGLSAQAQSQVTTRVEKEASASLPIPRFSPLVASQVIAQSGELEAAYREAFQWDTVVTGARLRFMTHEDPDLYLANRGWKLVDSSEAYWPTLSWSNGKDAAAGMLPLIPLISKNTGQWLAKENSVVLQESMGIIFGKVPAGWRVQIEDKDGRFRDRIPLYVSAETKPLAEDSNDVDRYFVFLNVRSDSYLVSALKTGPEGYDGKNDAAFMVPALSSIATYLDLTQIQKVSLEGIIRNAGEARAPGLARMNVQVTGQKSKEVRSRTDGTFKISDLILVGSYPLFVDIVDGQRRYSQRYRVRAEDLTVANEGARPVKRQFFFRDDWQLESWLKQVKEHSENLPLEEASIFIGSAAGFINRETAPSLSVSVAPFAGATEEIVESKVYSARTQAQTIEDDQRLEENQPVRPEASNFVALFTHFEGPAVLQFMGPDQTTIFSEYWPALAGVQVAPY